MLTKEQIENWRRVIAIQIEETAIRKGFGPGCGGYAFIMPEEHVIAYYERIQARLQMEYPKKDPNPEPIQEEYKPKAKPVCTHHKNTITGQNGTYCLDCEEYV